MTVTTETGQASPFYDFWLPDYCPTCNPAGPYADRCVRLATMTEPDAVTWRGTTRLVCEYVCHRCGGEWQRRDLWTAENLGLVLTTKENAA